MEFIKTCKRIIVIMTLVYIVGVPNILYGSSENESDKLIAVPMCDLRDPF